jgi:hypothetical protein
MRARSCLMAFVIAIICLATWFFALRLAAGDDPRLFVSLITVPVYVPAQGGGEAQAGPHQRSGPRASRSLPPANRLERPGSFRHEPSWSPEKTEQW